MVKLIDRAKARAKRHARVRSKVNGTPECPRLQCFPALQNTFMLRL